MREQERGVTKRSPSDQGVLRKIGRLFLGRSWDRYSATPSRPDLPDYEKMEGKKEWAGPWRFDPRDMRWHRPEYFYFRSALSGRVEQNEQLHRGPGVRPEPISAVESLDVPLAVLRSHPDTPGTLPEDREGQWVDTNPAWPELSINAMFHSIHAVWEESSADNVETFELHPDYVEDVTPKNSEPFDPTPKILSAVVVYFKPGQRPEVSNPEAVPGAIVDLAP